MILRAGLRGLEEAWPAPAIEEGYGPPDAAALPESLSDALDALERDAIAKAWLPPVVLEAYLAIKRAEAAATAELDLEQLCAHGRRVY